MYGLTTPDSTKGAGLWNCGYDKSLSNFYVDEGGGSSIKLSFWGQCEEGDAAGKNAFFNLSFNSCKGLTELIGIVNPQNVRNKLGLKSDDSRKRNYDSLFN